MQANNLPPAKAGKGRVARPVLAGAVVASLFVAPTVTAAYAAPDDLSEAYGQVINVDGLGLDVADAGYSYSANPSSPAAQSNPLNVAALNGALNLTLPTINLPVISDDASGLLELGQAGALSSYAIADTATHAKASAGVLGADGALALDRAPGDLATIDLTKLFGQLNLDGVTNQVLDVAELQLGALGSTTERLDGANPTHEYQIASATADLHSPLLSQLSEDLTATTTEVGTALNGLVGTGGTVSSLVDALNLLNINVLVAQAGISNAALSIDGLDGVVDILNSVITEELVSDSGLVSLNLGEGTVHLDLSKAIEGGLNDQPANTKLLDDKIASKVSTELTGLLNEVVTNLTTALDEILNTATFNLTANIDVRTALGGVAEGKIDLSGTLNGLLHGDTENFADNSSLVLLPGSLIELDLTSALNSIVAAVTTTTGNVLDATTGLVDALPGAIQGAVDGVVAPLIENGIEPLLAGVLEITINEQNTIASADLGVAAVAQPAEPAPEGELNYVTALAIDVLPDAPALTVGVDLGTSAVRAAAEYADVVITSPVPTDAFTEGDEVIVTGTGEPNTTVDVTLADGTPVTVDVDAEGNWTTTFPDVPAGEHIITATDGISTDDVTITVAPAATDADATDAVDADATDAVDADATDAVDADATDAVDADATDAVDADATDAVDADATDAVDADATDAVDADATDAVDADATDAVDADATDAVDADATDAVDADATDAVDADATDAVDADATDAVDADATDAVDADATDAVDADATDAVDADATDAVDADATDAVDADATDAVDADATDAVDADATDAVDADATDAVDADATDAVDADATDAVDADATDAVDADATDAVDADATDAVDADATDAVDADATDAVDADATDADGTDVDGDEDGEYLPVDIVTPLEGSTVEGPNVLVKGTSDPNAVVTVKATEVADSAIAKVFAFFQNAIAAPELVVAADDEGNWEVVFEEVEVGQYSVFADDGRTNDTTTFQVVEAAVDADATDADATDADATDADATDADATDADATDADATDADATDADATDADATDADATDADATDADATDADATDADATDADATDADATDADATDADATDADATDADATDADATDADATDADAGDADATDADAGDADATDADATDADATDADAGDADAGDADATDADAGDADAGDAEGTDAGDAEGTDAGDNDSNDSGKNDSKNDSKKDKLADTGANAPLVIGGIALLLVLAGGAVTVLRRKKA
ncbi:choice-of-anchor G family protein [Glutamicibacter sp. 2E12]|uniref:choice-of-anchor G family protein n=1 Tax=Glutamicibacter sp. 2E12 TaxID=3416181 RepID=UPI003CE93E03